MCMARHSMLSEKVGSMHACKHYVCARLVQNAVCTCCALCRSVKIGLHKVTGERRTYVKAKYGNTDKRKYEEVCWSLSLVPAVNFVVRVSLLFTFSLSAFSFL